MYAHTLFLWYIINKNVEDLLQLSCLTGKEVCSGYKFGSHPTFFCLQKWFLSFHLGSPLTLLSFTYCYLSLYKNHWFYFLKYNPLVYTHSMESSEIHKTLEQVLKLLVSSLGLNMHTLTDTPHQPFLWQAWPKKCLKPQVQNSLQNLTIPFLKELPAPLAALNQGQHEENLIPVHWWSTRTSWTCMC